MTLGVVCLSDVYGFGLVVHPFVHSLVLKGHVYHFTML
jgi:hypothetical protein